MTIRKKNIVLRKNEERRLIAGHQWIFSNEIHAVNGAPKSGDIVEIVRHDMKRMGIGFYNPHSLIASRFLSAEDEEIDFKFFERHIASALAVRKKLFPKEAAFRVVHGESDFLPGLIVDKYNEYLSVQTFSAGMDSRLTLICDVLVSMFSPRGIVERNESPLRSLEELPLRKGIIRGTVEPTIIELHGLKFRVDLLEGQKTGFFLDQRDNRTALHPFAKDASVLDCFCNEGGFGLYAAHYGAKCVAAVDSSEFAIEKSKVNATLNNLHTIAFKRSDAFETLSKEAADKKKFDIVILDPPSFTKNRKTVATAVKGYKELNSGAMGILNEGGILATASCSHHITEETFLNILNDSAVKAGRKLRLLHFDGAAADHPTLPAMPETKYLKFALVEVD
ncbi:MAG TPA: class I SAM-dependent rRNA methyltransferase [Bacteroidota bacterium]|nr:class I SAM-dependent rRNA methyltransferase [Bacteroidota bacterium]